MDIFDIIYLYVGSGVLQDFVREVLDVFSFIVIFEGMVSKKFIEF